MKRIRSSAAAACVALGAAAALSAGLTGAGAEENPAVGTANAAAPSATAVPTAASSTAVATAPPDPGDTTSDGRTIAWRACENADLQKAGIECGDLAVPLDYADPTGRQITVAVSRLKATAPAEKRLGSLLVNFGGPGGTGVEAPLFLADVLPPDLVADYDLIGFDPRGVGASRPALDCRYELFAGGRYPDFRPSTGVVEAPGSNEQTWREESRNYSAACEAEQSDLLPFVGSRSVVQDMESLRAAFGTSRLNFWGFSYGTYLGQLYATTFPAKTGRFVLDANVDPDDVWYPSLGLTTRSFEEVSQRLWAWIAEHDDVYGLGTTADTVEAAYYREENDLRKNPLESVGPTEWNAVFTQSLYSQDLWPYVASVFAAQARGDSGPLTQLFESSTTTPEEQVAEDEAAANFEAANTAVSCGDAPWPHDYAQWRADGFANDAVAPFNTWLNVMTTLTCGSWAVAGERPTVDGTKAPPILFASTTHDPATPFLNSLNVRLRFPESVLLADIGTVAHASTAFGNECMEDVVFAYFRSGALPPRQAGRGADATCPGLPVPDPLAEDIARANGDSDAAPAAEDMRALLGLSGTHPPYPAAPTAPAERRARAKAALRAAIIASHFPGRR